MALSWSLFGLLAVMCGGLLASLHALVGRMDTLRSDLTGDMRQLRTDLTTRMERLDTRMDRLEGRLEAFTHEVRVITSDIDRRLRGGGL